MESATPKNQISIASVLLCLFGVPKSSFYI
jgi:hypothetical protein